MGRYVALPENGFGAREKLSRLGRGLSRLGAYFFIGLRRHFRFLALRPQVSTGQDRFGNGGSEHQQHDVPPEGCGVLWGVAGSGCPVVQLMVPLGRRRSASAVIQERIETARELGWPIPEPKGRLLFADAPNASQASGFRYPRYHPIAVPCYR